MKRTKKPSSLQVRMPEDLKDWLKEKAASNFRSLNGEIIARLEQSKEALPEALPIDAEPKSTSIVDE